jgi:hypothetical protein
MGLNEVFKKVAGIESNATELTSHKVELGYLQDVQKKAETQLKKYSDIPELFKYWQSVSQWITSNEGKISKFKGTRSAYLMGLNDIIPELENNFNEIENKLKSVGLNAMENAEYKKGYTALVQLKNLLIDLKKTTDLPQFK